MRILFLILITMILCVPAIAGKKKKRKQHPEYIQYTKGTYVVGKSGNVYTFFVHTLVADIIIDSVWFGATPVPCDVFETRKLQRLQGALPKGNYQVQVNKNLYENFHQQVDSSLAYQQFKAPFAFKGDAVLLYTHQQKRYYKVVGGVTNVAAKGTR